MDNNATSIRSFLELPYDKLEQLNLEAKKKRAAHTDE